ncbi:MAG TPA: DUF1697 domain-containing protein [Candidatus Gracilibacteria bacterium]
MKTYISLLRGINVSGQKKILMEDLRKLCGDLGWENVETYIQSGNIVYQSKATPGEELSEVLSQAIKKAYGFEVSVMTLTPEYLREVVEGIPFTDYDEKKLYMTFFQALPEVIPMEKIAQAKAPTEVIVIGDGVIYLYCPEGYGNTKLSNNFLEKTMDVAATTRNFNTVNILQEMSRQ